MSDGYQNRRVVQGFAVSISIALCVLFSNTAGFAQQPANNFQLAFESIQAHRYADAEQFYKKALTEPNLPEDIRVQTEYSLSFTLLQQNKYAEAETYLIKNIPALEKLNASKTDSLADIYTTAGIIEQQTEKLDEAKRFDWQAYDLMDKTSAGRVTMAASNLLSLASAYLKIRKQPEQAIELLKQLDDELAKIQFTGEIYPRLQLFEGLLLVQNNQADEGAALMKKAIDAIHQLGYENQLNNFPGYYEAMMFYAEHAYSLGNLPEAAVYYQKLSKIPGAQSRFPTKEWQLMLSHYQETQVTDTGDHYVRDQKNPVHRWSDQTQTLNIYIAPGEKAKNWKPVYPAMIQEAFNTWEKALNGKPDFVFVDSPKKADVNVFWLDERPANSQEETEILGQNVSRFWGPYLAASDIRIYLNSNNGKTFSDVEFYNTILHEIGHLMGIGVHSKNAKDIMYPRMFNEQTSKASLSERDINTIQALYRLKPDVTNPDGYHLADFEKFRKKKLETEECEAASLVDVTFDLPNGIGAYKPSAMVCHKRMGGSLVPVMIPSMGPGFGF